MNKKITLNTKYQKVIFLKKIERRAKKNKNLNYYVQALIECFQTHTIQICGV